MNGILLIDKSEGWTSSDVVVKLKGVLHERRIGHSGTLDPMATGLLTVFVGRATRAVEFAERESKRYIAHLRLGLSTDTQDITGSVLDEKPVKATRSELEAALCRFRGEITQLPPMYSAVKVNGRRLYAAARNGETVERRPRRITVYNLDIIGNHGSDYILDVRCSKGSYIRTLCSDIGDALGCGGCMSALRRVGVGEFSVSDAHSMDEVARAAAEGRAERLLLSLDTLFPQYPKLSVGESAERRLRCGGTVKCAAADGRLRVYSAGGEFLLLGEAQQGELRTIKSFFEV